jgi:hypothetical protein
MRNTFGELAVSPVVEITQTFPLVAPAGSVARKRPRTASRTT